MSMEEGIINEEGFNPVYKGLPPFMKYENGFGYKGVLLEHIETGKLQCHLCGHLVFNIAKHLHHKHKEVTPTAYKAMVGINHHTPLVSPTTSKKIKNNFLNLTEEKKQRVIALLRENNKSLHKDGKWKKRERKGTIEMQNTFGTCPEQCKAQFWKEYNALGHIPTNNEMSGRLRHMVYSRFGTYQKALLAWGVSEKDYRAYVSDGKLKAIEARAENDFFPKYTDDEVRQKYEDFYFRNRRLPTWGEVKQYGLPGRVPFTRVFGRNKSEIESSFKVRENELA